jgi:hypothetical protein
MARTRLKDIIRIGSQVKIVNPITVLRWGYPLTKQIVKDTIITQEQKDAINALVEQYSGVKPLPKGFLNITEDGKNWYAERAFKKILDELAYLKLRNEGFGGQERQLFTLSRESLRDKIGNVVERKVVKTGKYFPASGGYDSYYGEYDWEPGGLANEKTHVLFRVHIFTDQEGVCPNINNEGGIADGGVWFDKVNLELPVIERYYR